LKESVQNKFTNLTDSDWDEYYSYISEQLEEEKNTKRYMFKKLQGALWLREAFLQGQNHRSKFPLLKLILINTALALTTMCVVCIENMNQMRDETIEEWY
jgi:hypothetical protein